MFFIFLSIFIGFTYLFLMLHITSGWKRLEEEKLSENPSNLFISVVIPFKNEENNLPELLQKLSAQFYQNFEVILVNDHSADNFLQNIAPYESQIKLFNAATHGKKGALKQGIAQAKGDLIVCTDADCSPSPNWLQAIAQYQEKENCDLIIAPVQMVAGNTFFSKMQSLEFASLIATGAGAAAANMPILCNGANLAFTPKAWQESIVDLKEVEASGDDMFLLMSIKKRKGKIRFLKSAAAIVQTASCETISDFFNQRKRWVSKSKSYSDIQIILVALLVLGVCSAILGALAAGFFNPLFWKAALFLYLLKLLADISILMPTAKFFRVEKLLIYIPLLELIYPFYVLISVIGGFLGRFRWKSTTALHE